MNRITLIVKKGYAFPNNPMSCYLRDKVLSIFEDTGLHPNIQTRNISVESAMLMAEQGKCVCVVPSCLMLNQAVSLSALPLESNCTIDTVLVWYSKGQDEDISALTKALVHLSESANFIQY